MVDYGFKSMAAFGRGALPRDLLLWPVRRHLQGGPLHPPPSPFHAATASFSTNGTRTNPATGSAHDHPSHALSPRPANVAALSQKHARLCTESARTAPLLIARAMRRLAAKSANIRNPARAVSTSPTTLGPGSRPNPMSRRIHSTARNAASEI